jgi:hypothetical protein
VRRLYSLRIERDMFETARLLGRSRWRSSRAAGEALEAIAQAKRRSYQDL